MLREPHTHAHTHTAKRLARGAKNTRVEEPRARVREQTYSLIERARARRPNLCARQQVPTVRGVQQSSTQLCSLCELFVCATSLPSSSSSSSSAPATRSGCYYCGLAAKPRVSLWVPISRIASDAPARASPGIARTHNEACMRRYVMSAMMSSFMSRANMHTSTHVMYVRKRARARASAQNVHVVPELH